MSRMQRRRGFHVPVFLALLGIVAGLAVFIVALPLTAQSPEPSADSPGPLADSAAHADALAIYDADGDGAIDVDEFLKAVDDHLAGRIDKAQARRVMELHLGGTLADIAAGAVALSADKDWARIACHWLGCGPLVPTATPTDTPVPGPPYSPTPTDTPTDTPTEEPTEEPTVPPTVPPTAQPPGPPTHTPTSTPIPTPTPLDDPCDYYDSNKNGQIDKSEVQTAIAHHKAGNLNRSSMLLVIACYLNSPKPPPPAPSPTNTPVTPTATPTPTHTPSPTPTPPLKHQADHTVKWEKDSSGISNIYLNDDSKIIEAVNDWNANIDDLFICPALQPIDSPTVVDELRRQQSRRLHCQN